MKKALYILLLCFFNQLYGQVNLDFETGNANGWTLTGLSSIQTGTGIDPCTASFPTVFPGGPGNNTASLMLANGPVAGYTDGSASQTFMVTNANSCFTYNYAAVLQAAGHSCDCNPKLDVSMFSNGMPIPCAAVQVVQGCSNVTGWLPAACGGEYLPWTSSSFDLRPYIGQNVTVRFEAVDCCAGGHFGYAYIDCSAKAMGLFLNGNSIPSNQTNTYLCNGVNNIVSAPLGFDYSWTGPNPASPVNGATTYSINALEAGTYSVNLSLPSLTCANINLWTAFGFVDTPVADFNVNPVCFGSPMTFTNTSVTSALNVSLGVPTTYSWSFADGTPVETVTDPTHLYGGTNTNTTYTVSLIAAAQSCTTEIVKPVLVASNPAAAFASSTVCYGAATQMQDNSNGNGNPLTNFEWDFSFDGTIDVTGNSNPAYVFPYYGDNAVSYTVSTTPAPGLTCSSYSNANVWVDPLPEANFSFVNKCVNAQPNSFDASISSIPTGSITGYSWTFGDGQTASPITSTITNTYGNPGVYTVSLTLTSDKGCIGSISHPAEVYQKPLQGISASSLVCLGSRTTFTASALPNSGNVVLWQWDVNGTPATYELNGKQTGYTFATEGWHTLNLLATTDYGCQESFSRNVYTNYTPKPDFTVDDPDGCYLPHCVTFTDNSTVTGPATISNWNWNFGNGTTANRTNNASQSTCYKNLTSNQLAMYTVTLTTKTDSGCVRYEVKKDFITVYPKPIANYTIVPEFGNVVVPIVHFINQSIDYTDVYWQFGDGKTDNITINPDHYYESDDSKDYYSSLIVKNQYGCSDTAYVKVNIAPDFAFYIPNAFTPNADGVNDEFIGSGIGIVEYKMWIYDRWGAKIYYTDDIEKKWDGKMQNKSAEAKQDVYTWKVEVKDVFGRTHDYIGHVTLLR